ncbi:4-hydroxybenzoate octaprenyltransferase [Moraxella equi]|uniref:4-hydroxybenzoate octaprenyltransferase n=1 Tax=Moraxella equi TaxID=60442 RepID=A0A378QPF3_9GAMM|nr:4-hydroxybenzoate octaprenyltransferase [Moraxella equi]OPH35535.1 4-hydroxybenzoate polyprenyltransferase [Moraxella equi]STZ02658.1 4-hydroxybenzoate octaprenyltransferase [Moraxella equi]
MTATTYTFKDKLIAWLQLTRFDKPVGTELLLYPTLWALFLASASYGRLPSVAHIVIFTLGAVLMRASGCAINDFADRKVDGQVKRTKNRPLADGRLSAKTAVLTFVGLSGLSACFLFFLPVQVFYWSLVAVFLAFIYPFMKRYTHLPQVVLAMAFGWAVPMAYVASIGTVDKWGWLVFVAYMCWTVAYDTMYAMCDKDDDVKIGVKSTAILFEKWFGDKDVYFIMVLNGVFLVIMTALVHRFFGVWSACGLAVGLAGLFAMQYDKIKTRERLNCFTAFRQNAWVGRYVFLYVAVLAVVQYG